MDDTTGPRGGKGRSACDLCRHRKIRCDRNQPACENCHIAGLPCTFSQPVSQHRKSTRQRLRIHRELAETKARVRELETALLGLKESTKQSHKRLAISSPSRGSSPASPRHLSQAPLSYLPDTHDFDTALAAFQWHISYCGLWGPLSAQRAAFYSLIQEQTGCTFNVDDFSHEVTQSFNSQQLKSTKKVIEIKWPESALVQRCLDYFDKNGLYSIFPIVDVEAVQILLNANVLDRPPNMTRAANRACLVAFAAMITHIHRHERAFASSDPDAYLQAALTLLPAMLLEPPDIRTLEAVTILMLYITPLGRPQAGELLLGIAVQLIYNLGANRIQTPNEIHRTDQRSQHLRALFWHCYAIDKEFSIRKSQPPLINDADCDLDLPTTYAQETSARHFYMKPLSSKELLFPSDLRFSLLKSKIFRLLYSVHSQTLPEARRLQHIRELDQELSDLKLGYPVNCRPEFFATENAPDYLFHDLSMRGVNIHLEYYYCLGKIHGASSSCRIPSPQSWSPLPSSAELCFEAARSSLIYIWRVRQFVNDHTFWLHAQFLLTAILSVFWYLITVPTSSTFTRDLKTLEGIAGLLAHLNRPTDDGQTFPPFYLTNAFVERLISLAQHSRARVTGT
ncbi:transcriptional regulator family: Fungal Specific TF [Penicillium cf. griseofulvum]|uniref:Transcriptional regulator family: Fungal Specific TF n=1 Tax=Penicillium cf. griseofulvum TaxID=2972120 RepID=A0A9W9JTS0_9EURO|nr:transcriptional regulator family: Fungal Specific TF [Penicillium cf. griseofulvum]KAJ5423503.1 transcriptional regulator family: Fungal Specific TF [Penicillium cf. griseofulvum]